MLAFLNFAPGFRPYQLPQHLELEGGSDKPRDDQHMGACSIKGIDHASELTPDRPSRFQVMPGIFNFSD